MAGFALRAIGFETVFREGGPALAAFDGAYHARLALWAEANFPAFLAWDPYLDWPHGGPVPWPPLQDLLVAALARLLGGGGEAVEWVLGWLGPAAGALTAMAVYAAARAVAARGVALGAAALYAGLGTPIALARVGDGDHHALVALCGASFLAAALTLLREDLRRRRAVAAALAVARLAVLLAWNGSLLYLILIDGLLLLANACTGRRALLVAHAAGLAACALAAAPFVATWPVRVGGDWSAASLSYLHLAVLVAAAVCAAGLAALEQVSPARAAAGRVARLAGLALACAAMLLALPAVRAGLDLGLRFVALADVAGAATVEQFPLLPLPGGRRPWTSPELQYGWLAWCVPLAPLGALLAARDPRRRTPALVLAAYTAVLAALTVAQSRYGNEFAPAGAIAFALAFGALAAALPGPTRLRVGAVVALAALAIAPGLRTAWERSSASWAALRGLALEKDGPPPDPIETLVRFARLVRAATPETRGFLERGAAPEYGVLAPANLGHAIRHHARRPVPADGFWAYVDPAHFARATSFYSLRDESEAAALAAALRTPYVVTLAAGSDPPRTVVQRLHLYDGSARDGHPRLERFRLVTEGPEGGVPFRELLGARRAGGAIYKLFEVVEGAVLVVRAGPGVRVDARLDLVTPNGRRFTHVAEGVAGADGVARLRVAFPSRSEGPTRALGPWRVRAGGADEALVEVGEQSVRSGAEVEVVLPDGVPQRFSPHASREMPAKRVSGSSARASGTSRS